MATTAHAQRPGQGEDDSAALVGEGRAALKRGDLGGAAKALDQAIALNPRRVEAYVLRSAVYAARKEYSKGIELMRRAQNLAPADEEVLTALGSQLVLSGDAQAGVPLLEQVVAKNAKRYDAQLLLGHHFHDASRWPDAIGAFEAYFASRPKELAKEDARHRIDMADAYLRSRQPAKALAVFQRAAAERKNDLRARIGVAWATAAIDCNKARTLLNELIPISDSYPEILLVDGQCALALGDAATGLALGRMYLEKSRKSAAAGHALVGEAHAAKNNLAEAKKELETAVKLEPNRRRFNVRLAVVLRRAGDNDGALATLEKMGPPASPQADPDWWIALGETLLAKGDAAAVVTRLAPIVSELPGDALIRTVFGAAQLQAGQVEPAVKTLTEADQLSGTPRSRKLLVDALLALALQKIQKEPAEAEQLLAKAEPLDTMNPVVLRNLGIARLALDKPADALPMLDRAAKIDGASITSMLAARARALTGDVAGARPLYEKALASEKEKDNAIEIAIDWAASEVAGGDAMLAVTALEKVAPNAKGSPLANRHKQALAIARHAAGVAAVRAGTGTKAVELLKAAVASDPTLAKKCDLALAAVVAGDAGPALVALKAVSGQSCPFPPPADTQATPILIAFTEGLNARRAARAVDKLTALSGKSSGPAAVLLNTSIRVVALEAAQDAYRNGQFAQARKFLTTARGANARVGADEVAHNLAVLDLVEGRVDAAIAALDRLAARVPEALVNLGIAYERKGDPNKALDAWRRARKAGVRFAPLTEWIEAKERIYGESGS
ncbi:MAG: tetratricopeptide repeat protein [Myxococcota bacterium]|nr:tetratricopeptide repeat protein [Myxococcota bacterium]